MTYNERVDYNTLFVPSNPVHSYCNIHPSFHSIGDFIYVEFESPPQYKKYRDGNFIKPFLATQLPNTKDYLFNDQVRFRQDIFFASTKGNTATIREALNALRQPVNDYKLRNLIEPILKTNLLTQTKYFKLNQHPSQ